MEPIPNSYKSFFSENERPIKFWKSCSEMSLSSIAPDSTFKLYKCGKKTKMRIQRYFHVDHFFLYYTKKSKPSSIIKGKAPLFHIILDYHSFDESCYYFILSRGDFKVELRTRSADTYLKFLRELRSRCILTRIGKDFKFGNVIGTGAFSKVHKIHRIPSGDPFAVKETLKEKISADKKGKDGIINEIAILRTMDNTHVVKLFNVYEDSRSVFMVFECVDGGDLGKKASQISMAGIEIIRKIMKNLFEGLSYIHEKGYIHRDLKPENILLKSPDSLTEIKIIDFGLATTLNLQRIIYTRCGTPGYIAPEILNYRNGKELYGFKVDVFSLGIIFHYLFLFSYVRLTRVKPFKAKNSKDVTNLNRNCIINFNNVMYRTIPDNSSFLAKSALLLLKSMLEKNPIDRISVVEVLRNKFMIAEDDTKRDFISTKQFSTTITRNTLRENKDLPNLTPKSNNEREKSKSIDIPTEKMISNH